MLLLFKSIFSKYLFTFTLILLLCIVSILFVMTAMVSDYTSDIQHEKMLNTAGNTVNVINVIMSRNNYESLDEAFADDGEMYKLLDYMARGSESEIYVFDSDGILVSTSDKNISAGTHSLDETVVSTLMTTGGDGYSISDVEGFFEEKHINSFFVERKEPVNLIVLASTANMGSRAFTPRITNITITVALWVFLAAMIALYIISRRTTKPLSDITEAAKNYAKGRFDQKVVVTGQDEVAELGKAINDMAESLAHIDEVRNSFLGNVSHDLRTPMTTISGFVDGILDGTIPEEKQGYYLNIISQEVRRLSRLVNSLLELSRLESGANIKMQDFNLTEKARTVLISLESKINDKHLEIEFNCGEEDIYVHADPDSIHQVIYNLMHNAIKFTQEKGTVSISITAVSGGKKNRKALFTIRNTGAGIPPEELPHIFERFYKTDRSRGLDKTGTGLGLYIAKTTMVNHGEDLTVESEVGKYTEFKFTLPMVSKPEKKPEKNSVR